MLHRLAIGDLVLQRAVVALEHRDEERQREERMGAHLEESHVVLPGEQLRVFVLKEGKEAAQGVAYLDDGTMIVVDNAKRFIGSNVNVVVTSVLQTQAGRMIFTRLREETESQEQAVARG